MAEGGAVLLRGNRAAYSWGQQGDWELQGCPSLDPEASWVCPNPCKSRCVSWASLHPCVATRPCVGQVCLL